MSTSRPIRGSSPGRTMRKFFVSAFVIFTFVVYALHERLVSATSGLTTVAPGTTNEQLLTLPQATPTTPQVEFAAPQTLPSTTKKTPTAPRRTTATPRPSATATARANGQYRDGAYTGPAVDAYWGLVQVKAVIQNGKIANVEFLQYPSDRRTSQRINQVAVPYLQQEALQVQSAEVDIISGATLTSEGFIQSLQEALASAKN